MHTLCIHAHTHAHTQVGPIPYGEVFGERFGFATVKEFLAYMDGYAVDAAVNIADSANFKAPLYVFDSELMQNHFRGHYDNKGIICYSGPLLQFTLTSYCEITPYCETT